MTDTLAAELERYRADRRISAALLVSEDGFLVAASAAPGVDIEALAAQIAPVVISVRRLSGEIEGGATRLISIELAHSTVLMAPFENEVLLALVGEPGALTLTESARA